MAGELSTTLSFIQVFPVFPFILPGCCDDLQEVLEVLECCDTAGVGTHKEVKMLFTHTHTQ